MHTHISGRKRLWYGTVDVCKVHPAKTSGFPAASHAMGERVVGRPAVA